MYNKDKLVAKLKCERDAFDKPHFLLAQKYDSFLPFGFQKGDVDSFMKCRRAPSNREHIREVLTKCGCDDLEGLIHFSYCTSLNDTFWIRPEDREITWNEVSLYRNKFQEDIAEIALDGKFKEEKFPAVTSAVTPEIGTDGSFAKCWKRFGNEIFLIKRNGIAEREAFSEHFAYELAKEFCESVVPYDLLIYHNKLATKCPLFTCEEISFAPAVQILGASTNFQECMEFFDKIGSLDNFREMMILDALTLNTDRHLKNFGVLYDAENGTIKSMAPIFDNNFSLLPFASIADLKDYARYLPTRPCAFNDDFNRLAIECLTPELKRKLNNLIGFRFQRNQFLNEKFDEERLTLLETIISYQINNLLQNKTLYVTKEVSPEEIKFDNLSFEMKTSEVPQSILPFLRREELEVPPFFVHFEDGTIGEMTGIKISVVEYNETFYFDVYDAFLSVSQTPNSLVVSAISDFKIIVHGNLEDMEMTPGAACIQISNRNGNLVSELSITIPCHGRLSERIKEVMVMSNNTGTDFGWYKQGIEDAKSFILGRVSDAIFFITPTSHSNGVLNDEGIVLAVTSPSVSLHSMLEIVDDYKAKSRNITLSAVEYDYAVNEYQEGDGIQV